HAVALDPLTREPIGTHGDVRAFHLHDCGGTCLRRYSDAAKAETVLRVLVSRPGHREEDLALHQLRLVKRDPTVAIREKREPVHRAQLHQRHAAFGFLVDDLDTEVASLDFWFSSGQRQSRYQEKEHGDPHDGWCRAHFTFARHGIFLSDV